MTAQNQAVQTRPKTIIARLDGKRKQACQAIYEMSALFPNEGPTFWRFIAAGEFGKAAAHLLEAEPDSTDHQIYADMIWQG